MPDLGGYRFLLAVPFGLGQHRAGCQSSGYHFSYHILAHSRMVVPSVESMSRLDFNSCFRMSMNTKKIDRPGNEILNQLRFCCRDCFGRDIT